MKITRTLKSMILGQEIPFALDQYQSIQSTMSRLKREGWGEWKSRMDNKQIIVMRLRDTIEVTLKLKKTHKRREALRDIHKDLELVSEQFNPATHKCEITVRLSSVTSANTYKLDVSNYTPKAMKALQRLILDDLAAL